MIINLKKMKSFFVTRHNKENFTKPKLEKKQKKFIFLLNKKEEERLSDRRKKKIKKE